MRKITLLLALVVCTLSMQNCSTEEYEIQEELSIEENTNLSQKSFSTLAVDNLGVLRPVDGTVTLNDNIEVADRISFINSFPSHLSDMQIMSIKFIIKQYVFSSLTTEPLGLTNNGNYKERWTIDKNEAIFQNINNDIIQSPYIDLSQYPTSSFTGRGDGSDLTSGVTPNTTTGGTQTTPPIANAPTSQEREGEDLHDPHFGLGYVIVNIGDYTYYLHYPVITENYNPRM